MPGTTPNGYRYPEDTDPVADGAQAVRNLAQDCDDIAGRTRSGQITIHVAASDSASDTVTFPVGFFGAAPEVVCTARGALYYARPGNTTADDVVIHIHRRDGSSDTTDVAVDWIAHRN